MNYFNAFEEVYEILSCMNKSDVMRIPENILNNIVEKRNKNFKTSIDKNNIFDENNMSNQAFNILCFIAFNYWMNENDKNRLKSKFKIDYIEGLTNMDNNLF